VLQVWEQIKEIYLYREMLRNLVSKEIRARYKASVLGFLWTFANPLLTLAVYSFVFSVVMKSGIQHYSMFLFVALLPWNYLSMSIIQGTASLVQNVSLVKKIYFPRVILPLSMVLANMINYLLGLIILIPALALFHIRFTIALVAFPVVLVVETLLVTALTLIVAVGNVYFRDLEHIIGIFIMLWFFLTPIVYSIDTIPANLHIFFNFNPASPIIEAYRAIFLYGKWPDWVTLGWLAFVLFLLLLVCWFAFMRLQRTVAEEI
jgi:lipopolysaccharide transport system permease protein